MTAAELLASLEKRGITVIAHNGNVRYKPRGALSVDELAYIRAHKLEMLAALEALEAMRSKPHAECEHLWGDWYNSKLFQHETRGAGRLWFRDCDLCDEQQSGFLAFGLVPAVIDEEAELMQWLEHSMAGEPAKEG